MSRSNYSKLIARAIGTDDDATTAVVEELMRTDRTGLDGLSPRQFIELAQKSYADMLGLHQADELGFYCQVFDLPVPAVN